MPELRMVNCRGCDRPILDKYLLNVSDESWHPDCVTCCECKMKLTDKCFSREGKLFCRVDFFRKFGTKCSGCMQGIQPTDFVRRARSKVYHLECFNCFICRRQLATGDELYLLDDLRFICKEDFLSSRHHHDESHEEEEVREDHDLVHEEPLLMLKKRGWMHRDVSGFHHHSQDSPEEETTPMETTPTESTTGSNSEKIVRHREGRTHHGHKNSSEHKPTRVRTVLNERQLQTLRQCYNQNPRPDALMKEQLVEMTGLSPRVIRVWFQNKRCKDKKRTVLMKQLAQQERDGRHMQNIVNMRGVSLVASSPVRHDSPVQTPLDVHSYHPPWKAFADYALHHDVDPNAPHFQHLVNQMHGFDVGLPAVGPPQTEPPHMASLHAPQTGGPCTPLSYLHDHELHDPHSNLSSHVTGTTSEMSSPCTSE